MTIAIVVGAVLVGFVAGILVGRRNAKLVNTAVTDAQKAAAVAEAAAKNVVKK